MSKRSRTGASAEPKPRRHREMSADEEALWEAFTLAIAPLQKPRRTAAKAKPVAPPPAPAPRATSRQSPAPIAPPKALPKPIHKPAVPSGATAFEPRKARKLAAGKLEIEDRIDLHGYRQEEAHQALKRFLASAQARGLRFVKVITGKGRNDSDTGAAVYSTPGEGRGVLKRAVPRWLSSTEFDGLVVSFTTAGRGHGGEGALYVHVRRAARSRPR